MKITLAPANQFLVDEVVLKKAQRNEQNSR